MMHHRTVMDDNRGSKQASLPGLVPVLGLLQTSVAPTGSLVLAVSVAVVVPLVGVAPQVKPYTVNHFFLPRLSICIRQKMGQS